MELTEKLLTELQRRLKIGNRRGVHLNAIPANSRYKFDLNRLSHIDKNLPDNFVKALLSELPLKFRISWKDNVPDLNSLFEEDQSQLVRITKAFENLINQTEAIESEKGINTFGFGFPILARRDRADNKLTVAPILIWSLRIKRTKEFNTWEILRNEEDPIYINEVLINHLSIEAELGINLYKSAYKLDWYVNNGSYTKTGYIAYEFGTKAKIKQYVSSRLGFRYYAITAKKAPKHNVFIAATINSNLGQADFSELSFGYVYCPKRKNK